jgi:YrbI family 3-deoxy-D-manno-octulosonate 8-phosphate phosphatase
MEQVVAFIPARSGSKSILGKNIKLFCGKPLIHWVINACIDCEKINKIFVSTDGESIKTCVDKINHKKLFVVDRSPSTATDEASTESAMLEFANNNSFKHIVLVQATSPLLKSDDLNEGIIKYFHSKSDSLLSVVRQKRFLWDENNSNVIPLNYDLDKRPRRQEFDGFLVENGSFYITSKKNLVKSKCRLSGKIAKYEMDSNSYYELDELEDWNILENIKLNKKVNKHTSTRIKLFASDVDGVLTDSGMYYSEYGDELKKFNTRDGVGFRMMKDIGIHTAIITSENTQIVEKRAKKLNIDFLYQGVKNKVRIVEELCQNLNINFSEIAFIGDDINDTELLKIVGFSACPNDAVETNKEVANYICRSGGGEGCVREFAELIKFNFIKSRKLKVEI